MARGQHHRVVLLTHFAVRFQSNTADRPTTGLLVIVRRLHTRDTSSKANVLLQIEVVRVASKVLEQLRIMHVIRILSRRREVTEGHELLRRVDHSGFHHAGFAIDRICVVIPQSADVTGHFVAGGLETAVQTAFDAYQTAHSATNDGHPTHLL